MKRAAKVIEDNVNQIMALWEIEVRKQILASRQTSEIALLNHLPNLLNSLIKLLERNQETTEAFKDVEYKAFLENSSDHGRHRAAASNYSVDQIIHEYIIFHQVVTDLLVKHNLYEQNSIELLKHAIERAMLKSADAFSVSIQEMQEKLVGTLAHDIRNPLTTAQLALQMMDEDDDPEEMSKLRAMALRAITKSLRLTEGLLDTVTVKAGEGIMMTFAEDDLVHHVKWVHEEASEIYNHEFRLDCPKEEIRGVFDGTAIRRALENLITNAIKYGASNKPITIKIVEYPKEISLTVHNVGNPIPVDKQEDIFKFLGRSKESNATDLQSWGIGLTLVRIVAEAHGGHVKLSSSEKLGTSFTIIIQKFANKPGKSRTKLNYRDHRDPN